MILSRPVKPRQARIRCEVASDPDEQNRTRSAQGEFVTRIRLQPGGQGVRICLLDRWFNPADPVTHEFATYRLEIPGSGQINDSVALVAKGRCTRAVCACR